MLFKKTIIWALFGMTTFVQAEFLVQGSFSVQMNDRMMKLSGYDVSYDKSEISPYDVSVGYMLAFKDVAVMPVMVEGKASTLDSYLNTGDVEVGKLAPLEVLVKPGLRLTGSDIYVILGYQLGDFKQNIEQGHKVELAVKPNFYGAGYTKMLSDYLDYLAEVKVYYHSSHSYAFDFQKTEFDPQLVISDARVRLGFRFKI